MLPLVYDEYIMAVLTPHQIENLQEQAKQSRGHLSHLIISDLLTTFHCDIETLLKTLLPVAASFSQAPISQFNVGAIAYDEKTGSAYLGANLEFTHQALNQAVHAEQAAINNAWLNGARSVSLIAITDAPCGHCRQFMNEIAGAESLRVLLPTQETDLKALLPSSFGPLDLGNSCRLLDSNTGNATSTSEALSLMLREQLSLAYAPYSKNAAAVEVVTVAHGTFYGRYAENAAYNPSLSPMQSALSQLALAGLTIDDVELESVTLVESKNGFNQKAVAQAVLDSYVADITLQHVLV